LFLLKLSLNKFSQTYILKVIRNLIEVNNSNLQFSVFYDVRKAQNRLLQQLRIILFSKLNQPKLSTYVLSCMNPQKNSSPQARLTLAAASSFF
jgi:hypothetical protein